MLHIKLVILLIVHILGISLVFGVVDDSSVFSTKEASQTRLTYGQNLFWVHERSSKKFYMMNSTSSDNYELRDGFHVREEVDGKYSFEMAGKGGSYLKMDTTSSKLIKTSSASDRSLFVQVPIQEIPTHFHLYYNDEAIVSYQTTSPISYFLHKRYPNEPPAEFYLTDELDVKASYGGKRVNIMKTVDFTHVASNKTDKSEAYSFLYNQMLRYAHVQGREIFYLAYYILTDLGSESELFKELPNLVQLLHVPRPLAWNFIQNGTGDVFPMKYHFASSSHEELLPYAFNYNITVNRWSITFADAHQIISVPNGSDYYTRLLTEKLSAQPVFEFELGLAPDHLAFEIYIYASFDGYMSAGVNTKNQSDTFNFQCYKFQTFRNQFDVQEYLLEY